MTWLDGKAPNGWEQLAPQLDGNPVYNTAASILRARRNLEREDLNTFKSSSLPVPKSLFEVSPRNGTQWWDTGNLPVAPPPSPMFGKRRRELANSLNLDRDRLEETLQRIGKRLSDSPCPIKSTKSPLTFSYVIIVPYRSLGQTIVSRLSSNEYVKSSMARLVLGSRAVLGKKLAWIHFVKIRVQSFGVATEIKEMLLSMNLGEESTLRTSSDGRTDIRSLWRLKDHLDHCLPNEYGLPPTCIPMNGTQNWMKQPRMR